MINVTTEAILEKQFQLYVPFTRNQHHVEFSKNYTENPNGTLTIEGIASTVNKDLQGDIILPSAIHSMKEQLLTTTKNLHGDHKYGLDGIYGAIKEVLDSDDTSLKIRADLLKAKSAQIKDMLDVGVNLGLSIGGKITEYTILEDQRLGIKDLHIMEISPKACPKTGLFINPFYLYMLSIVLSFGCHAADLFLFALIAHYISLPCNCIEHHTHPAFVFQVCISHMTHPKGHKSHHY